MLPVSYPLRDLSLSGLAVFLTTFSLYSLTMPQSITLEDAGLFQTVCQLGGVGHPPGYPLFILSCQGVLGFLEPGGVIPGNSISAFYASLACVLLLLVGYELFGDLLTSVLLALLVAVSATFWSQAIIIEVYTLAVLMFVLSFWLALIYQRTGSAKIFYSLTFVFALALSNHWPLQLLASPAIAIVVLKRWQDVLILLSSLKSWCILLLMLMLGLLPYLSLLQSAPSFAVYGPVTDFESFLRYITRGAYDDHSVVATMADKLAYCWWVLVQTGREHGVLLLPLMVIGLVSLLRRDLLNALSLLALYTTGTLLLISLLGFEYNQLRVAIFKPYPIIAYLAPAILIAAGYLTVMNWLEVRQTVRSLTAVVLVAIPLLQNFAINDRSDSRFAERYGEEVLQRVPENSVLFVQGDNGVGLIGFLHHVQGIRPDIELRSWNNLLFPNRLINPAASDADQNEARKQFRLAETRQVLSTVPDIGTVNRGLVFSYEQDSGFASDSSLQTYIEYLVNVDSEDLDGHEQELLFGVLLDLTRQHVGLLLFNQSAGAAEQMSLKQLQTTFPGKLATIETMIQYPQDQAGKRILGELLEAAWTQLPSQTNRQVLGAMYEFEGRIALLDPADPITALAAFNESVQVNPVPENASFCMLSQLGQANRFCE